METQPYEDILIRSRKTILEMLDDRGYDTSRYNKMLGPDILKLMPDSKKDKTIPDGLMMEVPHRTVAGRRAIVLYTEHFIKHTLPQYVDKIVQSEESSKSSKSSQSSQNTEYIIITLPVEEIAETFDKAALQAWTNHKMRIQFFNMARLVNNLMKHYTQPKFEYVPQEDHSALLASWHCRNKTQLQLIRFHNDPVARYMGLVPGDIIKITRVSYSAGEYILYRTCI